VTEDKIEVDYDTDIIFSDDKKLNITFVNITDEVINFTIMDD